MYRVTNDLVIVNDYYGKTPALGQFLEFMEGSDYKNFKKTFIQELEAVFPEIMVCRADSGQAVYIASKIKGRLEGKSCLVERFY